jgi:hypothetical protein
VPGTEQASRPGCTIVFIAAALGRWHASMTLPQARTCSMRARSIMVSNTASATDLRERLTPLIRKT